MPNHFFNKKRTGVETEQLKILTRPHMNKAGKQNSRGFPECAICQFKCNWFFYSEGQSFFLYGQNKDSESFTWLPV